MTELHVVALSGGKDSTAMALRLAELQPDTDFTYVCTPTGDELPEMFEHWNRLGEILGKRIVPVMGGTLDGAIKRQNALPNWRQRWCTRMLKIEPYAAWLLKQSEQFDAVHSYVGLRADEEARQGASYAEVPGVVSRYPMKEWGWRITDVWAYLQDNDITIPERTDCARCFFQTLAEWFLLWRDHPGIYQDAENQEQEVGHTFRSPGRDTWPAGLRELRLRFEAGEKPERSLKRRDRLNESKCRACSM